MTGEDTIVLDDRQEDHFSGSLNSVADMFQKKEIAIITRDCSRHVGSSSKDYNQHWGHDFGVGIMKCKRFWSFVGWGPGGVGEQWGIYLHQS